jgi:transcriptional/translational regulatory protein YebC/TACO1
MDKKTYYISVGSGDIVRQDDITDFEFEIQANEEELNELEELFEEKEEAEADGFRRAVTPYKEYHHDEENDAYDSALRDIYKLIHKLGTPETKAHIDSMQLNGPD